MRKYNLLEGKEAKFARFGCNFQEKLIRNAFLNENSKTFNDISVTCMGGQKIRASRESPELNCITSNTIGKLKS